MSAELLILRPGTIPYREAWDLQRDLEGRRQRGEVADTLLLLEHPPVYTRGRRTRPEELPMGASWYEMQGIEVVDTDRGGLVTYHGPGQLVAYPIVDLAPLGGDVHAFVRGLERVTIEALGEHGVAAGPIEGLTGVWTLGARPGPGVEGAARKIGSIGIHVRRGVSTHGLAVNVSNDLQPFEWVVPCGIEGVAMTSLSRELGAEQDVAAFGETVARRFAAVFDREPVEADLAGLPPTLVPHGGTSVGSELGLEPPVARLGGER